MALIDSILNPIFGKSKTANTSSQEATQDEAVKAYLAALKDYQDNGLTNYQNVGELTPELLANPELLGDTALYDIVTNPEFDEYTAEALRLLGNQASDGFSATDLAEQAASDAAIRRNQAGAIGAARQNMAQRGMSGSGMDMLTQLQIAQDSADQQALNALTRQGQAQQNRQSAAINLGNLANNLQTTQYAQKANAATAQDAIAKQNNTNANNAAQYNNQLKNNASQLNLQNKQTTADNNTQAANTHAQNSLNAAATASGMQYNQASDSANRAIANAESKNNSRNNLISGLIGGGASIAGALLSDENAKDKIKPEKDSNIEDFLNSISPVSFNYKGDSKDRHGVTVQNLERSEIGRDAVTDAGGGYKGLDKNDLLGALLQSVSYLHKKIK